jgi:RNA recognition motif-containing protein
VKAAWINVLGVCTRPGPFSYIQGEKRMQKKLFVGGLSYNTEVDEIRDLFAQAGEVLSANIIKDKFTNQSRGFGFVEMATEAQATEAIKMFNGKELGGRSLVVNESKPQEKRSFSGGDRGGNKNYGKRW